MTRQEVNFLQADLLPRSRVSWPWLLFATLVLAVLGDLAWQGVENDRLQEQIVSLQHQVAATQQGLANRQAPLVPRSQAPIVSYFQAIAANATAGVWLTRMQVMEHKIVLEGRTKGAKNALLYAQSLAEQPVFARKWRFSSLATSPVAGEKHLYHFQVTGAPLP